MGLWKPLPGRTCRWGVKIRDRGGEAIRSDFAFAQHMRWVVGCGQQAQKSKVLSALVNALLTIDPLM